MRRKPPDILITTPESLYLMTTSQVREILTGVEAVIVDEIHAVAQSKRGAHLALTLERLSKLVTDEGNPEPQRIGLSATQRPLERIAEFLVGPHRECEIVNAGIRKELDLEIVVPVEDMTRSWRSGHFATLAPPTDRPTPERAGSPARPAASLDTPNPRSIWPAIYPRLLELVLEHTSTIIFVNNRRGAERLAKRLNELHNEVPEQELPATEHAGNDTPGDPPTRGDYSPYEEIARAHHGSLAHEERVVIEEMLKSGKLPCLVATSSLELGIDMGAVDLVIQVESPKSVSRGMQRVGRAGHQLGATSKGRIFPKFRADLLECAVVAKRMRDGEIEETVIPRNPLDVLAQQIVAMVADEEWQRRRHRAARHLGRAVQGALARAARERPRHARRPLSVGALRRAPPAGRLGPHRGHGPRPQGRAPARGHQRRHDPRPRPLRRPPPRRPPGRRARRGDGLRGAARARPSCSARRPGGSRTSPATA